MMQVGGPLLRDIHQPPPPPWWPPAPGWWLLMAGVALVAAALFWIRWRRRQRLLASARLFDNAVAHEVTPVAKIGAMSELLRRAARRIDPDGDTLSGDDWLRFLDKGLATPVFLTGPGAVLRDGAFRREMSSAEVDAAHMFARERFIGWMTAR
ncbi:MAG: hypothetical protein JWL98_2092 [Xanthomonadaceae bacterium]|nr:hypothetical protein [Xanthomonadaceae bacterium]